MKTLTCAQMGGPCGTPITGSTPDEMMTNGMKHMDEVHPEMAADIRNMPKDDPKMVEWNQKFMADFEAAPEM